MNVIIGDFFPGYRAPKNMTLEQFERDLPGLLKRYGKTCKEMEQYMNKFILSDGTRLEHSYPKRFLVNHANSCALDSILFVLFFAHNSFFMNKLLSNDKSETPNGANFRQDTEYLLRDLYINEKRWTSTVRILQERISGYIEVSGCNDVKSGTQIWSMLANGYMGLQFPIVDNGQAVLRTYLDFKTDDNPSEIKDSEFLIYADDIPPIKEDKRPLFSMQTSRYKLVAAIFFGMRHYTSAILASEGYWVLYDDLNYRTDLLHTEDAEAYIFGETPSHKSQMLFYIYER